MTNSNPPVIDLLQVTFKGESQNVRYRHFHEGTINTDCSNGVKVPRGRLVGVIATIDNPDGTVAVGMSVVNPHDTPNRKLGKQIARGRLQSFLDSGEATNLASQVSLDELKALIRAPTFLDRTMAALRGNNQ